MTNKFNTALYTGVTNDLLRRVSEHRCNLGSFTSRYKVNKLVYVENFERMDEANEREKKIKGGSRQKKIDLINSLNPEWKDLVDEYLN